MTANSSDTPGIEGMGNVALHKLARDHCEDRDLLRRILRILEKRTKFTADPAREFVTSQLERLESEPRHRSSRRYTWKALAATAAGVVLVGVGQAVGGDVWKAISPKLKELLFTFNG